MPLDPSAIIAEVRKIADPTMAGHAFPADAAEASARWAAATRTYFLGLTIPALLPGTVFAAEAAMAAAFVPALGVTGLEAGLAAFAGVIVAGVVPGILATPPPSPPAWGALGPTSNGTARATQIAMAIDTWARTGLSAPAPGPPSIPWT